MHLDDWDETDMNNLKADESEDIQLEKNFESAFSYRATPLDQLITLDEFGMERSIKEMMEENELEKNDG